MVLSFFRSLFGNPRAPRSSSERAGRPFLEALEDRTVPVTLPSGFTSSVIASGLNAPTAMEIAPNGDLWVLQQGGMVKRFASGSTTADRVGNIATLGLDSRVERGLLGIAFDPNYANNKYVYLYYTAISPFPHNRVSRFTVNDSDPNDYYFLGTNTATADAGSTGKPTQTVILDLNKLSSYYLTHNGGAIHFGPDGKLYIATGDNAHRANSQSLDTLLGKILRINPDGTIPTDNPFYATATGINRAIWALGLRNPFTFAFQPGTGLMYINDVGLHSWEEVDQGSAGANYGWPDTEGNQGTPPSGPGTYEGPIYTYAHGSGTFEGHAITGGTFYDPASPQLSGYSGDYFFADFLAGWIHVLDTNTHQVSQFASHAGGVIDLKVADDGGLIYLDRFAGQVREVR